MYGVYYIYLWITSQLSSSPSFMEVLSPHLEANAVAQRPATAAASSPMSASWLESIKNLERVGNHIKFDLTFILVSCCYFLTHSESNMALFWMSSCSCSGNQLTNWRKIGVRLLDLSISPSQAKPSQAKPSQARPGQAKPSQAKPSQAKPSQAKSSQVKSSQAQLCASAVKFGSICSELRATLFFL